MVLNCSVGEDSWESLGLQGWTGQPVHPKGDQSWVFIGRTDVEAETPVHAKSWLIWKDPDAGKDWRQEEKGMTEDEIVGWPHQLNRHEFEQTQGDSEGQGSLAFCSPWGCKELDITLWLNKDNYGCRKWDDSKNLAKMLTGPVFGWDVVDNGLC